MKTCTAVLFIIEKTGNNPSRPPPPPAGSYSEEGTELPARDKLRGDGARAWGEPNITRFAHSG